MKYCKHCHYSEIDHCTFDPITKPPHCVCSIHEWIEECALQEGENLPPVCDKFIPCSDDKYCETCLHEVGCHH